VVLGSNPGKGLLFGSVRSGNGNGLRGDSRKGGCEGWQGQRWEVGRVGMNTGLRRFVEVVLVLRYVIGTACSEVAEVDAGAWAVRRKRRDGERERGAGSSKTVATRAPS